MLHQGMMVVGLPGNVPENALYGSYYGAGITCPVDSDELIGEEGLELGRALGRRVAQVTDRFTAGLEHCRLKTAVSCRCCAEDCADLIDQLPFRPKVAQPVDPSF